MKPLIESSRFRKLIDVPECSAKAMLYDNVESTGLVEYEYLMIVYQKGSDEPKMYVTSEVNSNYDVERCNSHFLCTFFDGQHTNLGSSDSYGIESIFEENAVRMIKDTL